MAKNEEEYIIRLVDKGVSDGLKDVMKQVNALRGQVDKLNGNVGKKGLGGSLMSLGGIVRGIGLAGLGYSAVQAGKQIIGLTANIEQTRIAFGTFLGSASEANKLIDELNEFANVTPFNNQQLYDSTKVLLSFGAGVDEAKDSMKFLGDISAGTGKDLKELSVIFGQIRGMGRLQGQDLLQLINAGFNPLQQISEKTGKSMSQLKDEMSKGLISFDMVKQAFIDATSEGGRFFRMMEKQSQTLAGRFSTFMGKLQMLMIKIGEALAPTLNALVELGIKLVDSETILGDVVNVVGALAGAWAGYKVATIAATIAQNGLNLAMLANPIGATVAGIALLIGGIVMLIRHFDDVIAKFREWGGVFDYIADAMEWLKKGWTNIVNAFKVGGIIGGLRRIGLLIVDNILLPFNLILKVMAKFDNGLGEFANKALKQIDKLRNKISNDEKNAGVIEMRKAQEKYEQIKKLRGAQGEYEAMMRAKSTLPTTTNSTSNTNIKGGLSEIKAGAPKNFNISIGSLIKEQNFETVKDTTQLKDIIRTEVSRLLLGVVNDVQTS